MGERYTPNKVLPVGAIMVIPAVEISTIQEELTQYFGEIIVLGEPFSVQDFTHYYDQEMGREIIKYFYYIPALMELEGAEQWKIW
ncbi:MAG TPA: DUF4416 family protein, partial [bacterium]|nr:DUF4416 family protein [bacterium]